MVVQSIWLGLTVLAFYLLGRNLLISLGLAGLLASSILASGLTLYLVCMAFAFPSMAALLLTPILAVQYLSNGRRVFLWSCAGVVLLSLLVAPTGYFLHVTIVCFAAAYFRGRHPADVWPELKGRALRLAAYLVCVTALYQAVVVVAGALFPTDQNVHMGAPLPVLPFLARTVGYAFLGWWAPVGRYLNDDEVGIPDALADALPWCLVLLACLLALLLKGAFRFETETQRMQCWYGVAALVAGTLIAFAVVWRRPYFQWWNVRYHVFTVVCYLLAVNLGLSVYASRMRMWRLPFSLAVLAACAVLGFVHAVEVTRLPYYAMRKEVYPAVLGQHVEDGLALRSRVQRHLSGETDALATATKEEALSYLERLVTDCLGHPRAAVSRVESAEGTLLIVAGQDGPYMMLAPVSGPANVPSESLQRLAVEKKVQFIYLLQGSRLTGYYPVGTTSANGGEKRPPWLLWESIDMSSFRESLRAVVWLAYVRAGGLGFPRPLAVAPSAISRVETALP